LVGSYVVSSHLAVAPQSGAKYPFYCTVYCVTLNSNCEAWRVSKSLKKIEDNGVIGCIFLLLKEKIVFNSL
jgi:hypothetical protein